MEPDYEELERLEQDEYARYEMADKMSELHKLLVTIKERILTYRELDDLVKDIDDALTI